MSRLPESSVERLVCDLQMPARYVGCERNALMKPDAVWRMAISYPDLYEVGMSNNGIRILYDIVNALEGYACERVFAVPPDFEEKVRRLDLPLYTLESYTPLAELEMIGFNISHELLCTNVLQILDLGRVPLLARERGENHPLIIAGGEAVSNPLPLSAFMDAFFLGDGEEGIVDLVQTLRSGREKGLNRRDLLDSLKALEGVYLPPRKIEGDFSGGDVSRAGNRVRKRVFRGLRPVNPAGPIVPNIRIAQDRAVVEITRGCANLCKFCHAGYYDLPYRSYDAETLAGDVRRVLDGTGYSELTLSSLSISDYRRLPELLNAVYPELVDRGVSISLPSLRVDRNTLVYLENLSDVRRSSLTFAVESACRELRDISHKRLRVEDLTEIVEYVLARGWRLIKFYFMIGLPGCDAHDEAGEIVDLLKQIYNLGRKRLDINVTISPFIPKPHTPFERERQMDVDYLLDVIGRIKRGLPHAVKIKNHDVHSSLIEGLLARGDERLGEVIWGVYRDGARLDSWKEHLRYSLWEKNLKECLPEYKNYLSARRPEDQLPWSFVETGYKRLLEMQRKRIINSDRSPAARAGGESLDVDALKKAFISFTGRYEVSSRARLRFSKGGMARYVPHLDLLEIIKRALRMARVPVSFTQGFNKRERISMGYPSPLGIESLAELCDLDLWSPFQENLAARINECLPPGIRLAQWRQLPGEESLMSVTIAQEYRIFFGEEELKVRCLQNLKSEMPFRKSGKKGVRDIPFHEAVWGYRDEESISILLPMGTENSYRIDQMMMDLAEINPERLHLLRIVKLRQFRGSRDNPVELK